MFRVFVVCKAPKLAPPPSRPYTGDVSAITTHQISHEGAMFSLANSSAGLGRIFRGRRRNSERSSRSCGTLHAHIDRGLRPGIKGSLALLRRMEASSVGCEGQLIGLRSVPCEMRPENIFHFYDERRLAGEDAVLYHNRDTLSALGVHVVRGWSRAHP